MCYAQSMQNESARGEAARVARIARLYVLAEGVFGSRAEVQRWLETPNRTLDGVRPLEKLQTAIAAREVEDLLGRVQYGIFG